MPRPGVHLSYDFRVEPQSGAGVENPLFDLLSALERQGSIRHAAQALGCSYRHAWGALRDWERRLQRPLVDWAQGRQAKLTPFAQRLLWAERRARARLAPHIEALRSELERAFALADDPQLELLDLAASHDLALPALVALAEREHGLHLALHFTGSTQALQALAEGRCSVAGFHVPRLASPSPVFERALGPLLRPGAHNLVGSHWRRQGLMLRRDQPWPAPGAGAGLAATLAPLAQRGLRWVSRQAGSGTRLLAEHLLAQAGLDARSVDGWDRHVEPTHVALASAIAAGAADVGLGLEAAAAAFGLAFVPLVVEDYHLVCLKPALESPALQRLRQTLAGPGWAQALTALPGYGAQRPGEVLSLTRALPWWRFDAPRRRRRVAARQPAPQPAAD